MKYNSKWGVLWKGTLCSGALANQEQDWGGAVQAGRDSQSGSGLGEELCRQTETAVGQWIHGGNRGHE